MEVMERLIYLFRKFHQLKISNEEYACMKTINFLNQGEEAACVCLSVCVCVSAVVPRLCRFSRVFCVHSDIRGLSNVSHLEQLNKRYWYVCQDYTEYKYTHQPKRFPEIMMCLPEIRCIAGEASVTGVCVHYSRKRVRVESCCSVFVQCESEFVQLSLRMDKRPSGGWCNW